MSFYARSFYFLKNRVSVSVGYYPAWQHGGFCIYDNGGRLSNEVLDINANLWKFSFSFTVWGIGRLASVLGFIPAGRQRRGFARGWFPLGRAE